MVDNINIVPITTAEKIKGISTGMNVQLPETASQSRVDALYRQMREIREMRSQFTIDTAEKAGKLRRLIQKHAPVDSGALKESWSLPETVQITPEGRVRIDNPLPYARIQDLGGVIRRVSTLGKSYIIRIRGQHYVQKAIDEYNATLAGTVEQELTAPGRSDYSTAANRLQELLKIALEVVKNQKAA